MTAHERQSMFTEGYEKHTDEIFRYFFFRVYDRERAKELSQETFMKCWKYLADGKDVTHLKAFLYQVARNLVIDEKRKKTEQSLDELVENGFAPVDGEKPTKEQIVNGIAAMDELQELDVKYKEAVTMRYVDDLTPKEIAQITGESENVISVRIHRGVKQLREVLAI